MRSCCICQSSISTEINIFKEKIGDPPVLIFDLINECMRDFMRGENVFNIHHSNICIKCTGKLLVYYKASLIMKKIRGDIMVLIGNASNLKAMKHFSEKSMESINCELESVEEYIKTEEEVDGEFGDDNDDDTKIEYINITDDLIDEVEDEIVLEDVPEVLKAEILEGTPDFSDDNSQDIMITVESDNAIETEKGSQSPKLMRRRRSTIVCTDCNVEFANKRKYNSHRRKEHFAGYVCDQCGKTFYSQSGFLTHRDTHKAVKEFVCTVCGQEYHHKVYLKRHMAWHSGEMPYECEVCSKRFVHKVALHKHKKIHNDIRHIQCGICGYKFRTNAHLNRHMLTHTGAKPHSCPICGKCFSQVYNMKVHIKEHEHPGSTRRNRIKCNKCAKTFINKSNYQDHIKLNSC